MAFVAQTRMVANAWLRPGNPAASSSCQEFLQETCEAILPNKTVWLVRADSGFYTEQISSYLESQSLNDSIATRMYPHVKSAVWGLDDWVELSNGIALNAMVFAHAHGAPRRSIASKKRVQDRPTLRVTSCSQIYRGIGLVAR